MKVTSKNTGNVCTLVVDGRIDALTSLELENEVQTRLPGCKKMIFDLSNVEFISSACLRVLLSAQRELTNKNGVVLRKMSSGVREIIEMTRLNSVFTIEP